MLRRMTHEVGKALRETGQAMERAGLRVEGSLTYTDPLSRHRTVLSLYDKTPTVAAGAWVAPSATLVGEVEVAEKASVWYSAVVKGDEGKVTIGEATNVQDRAVVGAGTTLGVGVTVGHSAKLFGCTIGDASLIGMDAVVEKGATVEKGAYVAAGAVVRSGTTVPGGQLWGGNPAKFLRALNDKETAFFDKSATEYAALAAKHAAV